MKIIKIKGYAMIISINLDKYQSTDPIEWTHKRKNSHYISMIR
ncbi:hypothetical protein D1AOALGA4SA_1044 [Olavius algarvensis Delta 1 endosymbiont]|nr:hypothetical protein D1AOALGA4SA_1044 [Olavius algarvensis Delta 1 endosymbiont]